MSTQDRKHSKREVQHGRLAETASKPGHNQSPVIMQLGGREVVHIGCNAYSKPDLSVARFLISQGQLIEELVALAAEGGRHG